MTEREERLRRVIEALLRSARHIPKWAEEDALEALRDVDKSVDKPIDDGRTVDHESRHAYRDSLENGNRPASIQADRPHVMLAVTERHANTGYKSRQSQARHNCRTGASRLRGSRERDAETPDTAETPRPLVGWGTTALLRTRGHAVNPETWARLSPPLRPTDG